jgi:predicted enzyme related to lactoylglutathione lyase
MIKGVSIVLCQVADMDRATRFYREVLGLTPAVSSPYWSDFTVGDTRIGLHPPFEGSQPPYAIRGKGWVLCLETDDIRSLKEKIASAGMWVSEGYHDTPSGAIFDFEDPDGNALQAKQTGIRSKDLA